MNAAFAVLSTVALNPDAAGFAVDLRLVLEAADGLELKGGFDGFPIGHFVASWCMESLPQKAPALFHPSLANSSITSNGIVERVGHEM